MFRIFIKKAILMSITIAVAATLVSCANMPSMKKPTLGSKSAAKTTAKNEKSSSSAGAAYIAKPGFKVDEKTVAAYNAALGQMRNKQYDNAILEMQKVAAMDERISGPWVNIGMAHKALGDVVKAKISFEKALIINSKNPFALNQLAILKRENGKFEEAEVLYMQALSTYPDYQNAHLNLAILCDAYLRKIACARDHYQQYLNLTGGKDKQVSTWMAQLEKQGS